MKLNEIADFEKANQTEHPVENQWHYPILTKYGFEPQAKSAKGFVRRYEYTKGDHRIICNTGASSDYWSDANTKKIGYWRELEPYLKQL